MATSNSMKKKLSFFFLLVLLFGSDSIIGADGLFLIIILITFGIAEAPFLGGCRALGPEARITSPY